MQILTDEELPSRGTIVKETILLGVFNVALPCFDVYSDLILIYKYYRGVPRNEYCDSKYYGNVHERWRCYWEEVPREDLIFKPTERTLTWGTLMLVPFLLNYFICWYAWALTDKRKTITWLAPLFNFYTQFVACKVIWQIQMNLQKGLQGKKQLERDLIQSETFCEAIPTFIILTYLAFVKRYSMSSNLIFNPFDEISNLLFLIAYSTSAFTATLGLAKNLKVGPCRILDPQTEILSLRFIVIFLSCLSVWGGKVSSSYVVLATLCHGPNVEEMIYFTPLLLIVPGLLVALFALWHQGLLKTSLTHPSIILMPTFTHFTFVCRKIGGQNVITFSPRYTLANTVAHCLGSGLLFYTIYVITGSSLGLLQDQWHIERPKDHLFFFILQYSVLSVPPTIIGVYFTLGVAFQCCCGCCCSASSGQGAILTSTPHIAYILGPNDELEIEDKEAAVECQELPEYRAYAQSTINHSDLSKCTNLCNNQKSNSTLGSVVPLAMFE